MHKATVKWASRIPLLLLFTHAISLSLAWSQSGTKTYAPGAYIVDMGREPQTVENGLKPYGLVYQLIRTEGIPVDWSINPTKQKDGTDFSAGGKTYRAGAFIIPGERATTKVVEQIKAWKAKGVIVDGPLAAGFSAPLHKELTSWPRAILDEQTAEKLIVPFYANAEIPVSSYVTAGNPTMLTNCGDVYVLPHADPQNWTEASGYFAALRAFVANNGYLWSGCHAVSALEGLSEGHFLSAEGLVPWGDHGDGTPPYTYSALSAGDPIMQFLGSLDEATLNGSEQIFLPNAGGWRSSTTLAVFDPDHGEVGNGKTSPGPATVLAYGRAFGDPKMGMVMYEGGHDLNSGTVATRVAAQRAYFNFLLLAGLHKAITITGAQFPAAISAGSTQTLSVTASGGVGTITYQWSNDCGGTFSHPTSGTTQFTAPNRAGQCIIKVEVADRCGRANFSSTVASIINGFPDVNPPGTPGSSGGKQTLDIFVTFSNGSTSNPGGTVSLPDLTYPDLAVAIGKDGRPLPGAENGKCADCFVGEKGTFVGPIINLAITGPVEYTFKIYSTLGEFVCQFKGKVTAEDLLYLQSTGDPGAGNGKIEYLQRIVWTARSWKGQRVGTGAYILMADLKYPANPEKGMRASSETFVKRFGHLR